MAGHLDAGRTRATRVLRRLGDDLPGAVRQVVTVPVEEHEVGAGHGLRRRHRGNGRRRRGRRVEGVAQAEEGRVVVVVELGLRARQRRAGAVGGHALDLRVELGLQRAEEAVFRRERQAGHSRDREGEAGDALVGELAVGVVDHQAGVRAIATGRVVHLHPLVAHAGADIGHDRGELRDEAGQGEVIEDIAHRAIGALLAADGVAARAEGAQVVDVVLAVAAFGLEAQAVAEAPADAGDAAPAQLVLRLQAVVRQPEADPGGGVGVDVVRGALHPVGAGASTDIQAGDRLRLGGQRQRQDRRGHQCLAKAHHKFSLDPIRASQPQTCEEEPPDSCCGISGR
ncbi:hypothetical protein ROTAS13_04100 [Roseomonas sp. TAS13]|nr:hypothetical protein ROTAS13_04100 [Roseomonas sp. TAS13]